MQKMQSEGQKIKIMKIVFKEPLGVSSETYLLSRLCLHIGLPSHPVTADSNTLRELCPFLNQFHVPHLPYRFIMAILSKILPLALSDWYQPQLTFYNYQANNDYLTPFSIIIIDKTCIFRFRPFYDSD